MTEVLRREALVIFMFAMCLIFAMYSAALMFERVKLRVDLEHSKHAIEVLETLCQTPPGARE